MIEILIVLAIVLSIALIVLVTIQPRQNQLFSMDATSKIGLEYKHDGYQAGITWFRNDYHNKTFTITSLIGTA